MAPGGLHPESWTSSEVLICYTAQEVRSGEVVLCRWRLVLLTE